MVSHSSPAARNSDPSTDYVVTQAWAAALHTGGFDGVRYLVRRDPAQDLVGVALFSSSGAHYDDLIVVGQSSIPAALIDEAWRRFEVVVVPIP